ncbi:MAG: asparagine synthase-related protein, partial [Leadbetterella sp.]
MVITKDFFDQSPIYFKWEIGFLNDNIVISNSLKSFLTHHSVCNIEFLDEFVSNDLKPLPYSTPIVGVYTLPNKYGVRIFIDRLEFFTLSPTLEVKHDSIIEALIDSINNKTIDFKKVSFHVSGGLDSTGLAAIAEKYQLKKNIIFTAVETEIHELSEYEYQKSFEDQYHRKVAMINCVHNDFDLIFDFSSETGELFQAVTCPSLTYHLDKYLSDQGYEAVVSGTFGDEVLGHGMEYLTELIKNRSWTQLKNIIDVRVKNNSLKPKFENWNSYSINKKFNITFWRILLFYFPKDGGKFTNFNKVLFGIIHSRGLSGILTFIRNISFL